MLKLIFFYMREGAASEDCIPSWDKTTCSNSPYVVGFDLDGMAQMVSQAAMDRVIDDALIIIESTKGMGGFVTHEIDGYVIPRITEAEQFIQDGDILFFRGGFKGWLPFIDRIQKKRKNWLIFYGANTGNERWPFWDVVLDDLSGSTCSGVDNKLFYNFIKPIPFNFCTNGLIADRPYDICIGASHIHDRKGQWRTINAVAELAKNGIYLNCVLPGAMHRGEETNKIRSIIQNYGLRVTTTGMLPRNELIGVYRSSKVFAKGGAHGQNDRGVLEAMLCGCIPMLTDNNRHPQWINMAFPDCIISNEYGSKRMADSLYELVSMWEFNKSKEIAKVSFDKNGFGVACDRFNHLLDLLVKYNKCTAKQLKEVYRHVQRDSI